MNKNCNKCNNNLEKHLGYTEFNYCPYCGNDLRPGGWKIIISTNTESILMRRKYNGGFR